MNNTRFTEASGENEDLKKGDGFTSDMAFVQRMEPFKSYQVMDHEGRVLDKNHEPKVSKEFAVNIYKKMAQMCVMDGILHEVQRQGRISFYMTHYGEEATIASAAALNPDDMIYGQVTIIGTKRTACMFHSNFVFFICNSAVSSTENLTCSCTVVSPSMNLSTNASLTIWITVKDDKCLFIMVPRNCPSKPSPLVSPIKSHKHPVRHMHSNYQGKIDVAFASSVKEQLLKGISMPL